MAIATTIDTILDGNRNLVIQLTGKSDGVGNETNVTKVVANGQRIKIRKLTYDVSGGTVTLAWNAPIPQTFAQLEGHDNYDYERIGGLINRSGGNGDINLSTSGFGADSSYTILLEMVRK